MKSVMGNVQSMCHAIWRVDEIKVPLIDLFCPRYTLKEKDSMIGSKVYSPLLLKRPSRVRADVTLSLSSEECDMYSTFRSSTFPYL